MADGSPDGKILSGCGLNFFESSQMHLPPPPQKKRKKNGAGGKKAESGTKAQIALCKKWNHVNIASIATVHLLHTGTSTRYLF